jgi:hypothetical protein
MARAARKRRWVGASLDPPYDRASFRERKRTPASAFAAAPHPDPLPALMACEEMSAERGEREGVSRRSSWGEGARAVVGDFALRPWARRRPDGAGVVLQTVLSMKRLIDLSIGRRDVDVVVEARGHHRTSDAYRLYSEIDPDLLILPFLKVIWGRAFPDGARVVLLDDAVGRAAVSKAYSGAVRL